MSFSNATEVFIFIILCSIYVCSILWIYGDAATRDLGLKATILPFIFVVIAALILTQNWIWLLPIWPIAYVCWFIMRPKDAHVITDD